MNILSWHQRCLIRGLLLVVLVTMTTVITDNAQAGPSLYLAEDFESYSPGQSPLNWLEQDDNLTVGTFFQTITWAGHKTYGTSLSESASYYTHYNGIGALAWQDYEIRGRLYHSHKNGGVGITFYSQVPNGQDRYYRLGHYPGQTGFLLIAHGTDISDGSTSINIETQPDSWYRFRIQVETLSNRVNIKVKVWLEEGMSEPEDWQIEAHDAFSSRVEAGTVGLWTTEAGFKAIDDLTIYSLDYVPGPMPAPTLPASFPQPALPNWPIGLFDISLAEHNNLQSTGFDTVHQFNSTQTLPQSIAYLNSAEAANLQVIQNMPSSFLYESDEFWINWVQTLSPYNALALWYLPEEPTDYGAAKRLYHIVREYDLQQRPAVTYFPITNLSGWCDTVDGILIGSFPEYWNVVHANIFARVDLVQEACPGWPVIGTPMFFDTNLDGTGDYPSPAEARFDAYTAIIAGAKGLHWFSYFRGVGLTDLWAELQTISLELSSLKNVLTSSSVEQSIQLQILSGPTNSPQIEGQVYNSIQSWQAEYQGNTYIFATNLATDMVTARFTGLTNRTDPVEVLFESRSVDVVNEAFEDAFAPNEVHVYYLAGFSGAPHKSYLPLIIKK